MPREEQEALEVALSDAEDRQRPKTAGPLGLGAPEIPHGWMRSLNSKLRKDVDVRELVGPGESVRGERANLEGLVLGCIDADFCK